MISHCPPLPEKAYRQSFVPATYAPPEIEEKQNASNEGVIAAVDGRVMVRIIRSDEELKIACSACKVIGLGIHAK